VNKENAELKRRVEAEQMYNEHACALDTLMEHEKVAEELSEKDKIIEQLKEELNKEKKKRKLLHKGITVTKV
jgi:DNA repair photolyase